MSNDMHQSLSSEILGRCPNMDASTLRDPDVALEQIGIDSLTVVDLILTFAERHGADLETVLDGVTPPQTLGELTGLISTF